MDRTRAGFLIYLSFVSETRTADSKDPGQYLLYLATRLFEWMTKGDDVYLQIRDMGLPDSYHKSLLDTYEEVKQDILRYVRTDEPVETVHTQEDEVWKVYRDVIYAVTQRKFLLIRRGEIDRYKDGKLLCEARVAERSDIPRARDLAKQTLLAIGIPQTAIMSHLLVISEAVTNILKHAREGKMMLVETDAAIHVLVEDKGPGFPLPLLPNTVLMAGYSTKKSLGQGFTLMMKMTELILLSTIPNEGSTLILVFNRLAKGDGA